MFIFDRYHYSCSAVNIVKYKRDIQQVTSVVKDHENCENYGIEYWLDISHPSITERSLNGLGLSCYSCLSIADPTLVNQCKLPFHKQNPQTCRPFNGIVTSSIWWVSDLSMSGRHFPRIQIANGKSYIKWVQGDRKLDRKYDVGSQLWNEL